MSKEDECFLFVPCQINLRSHLHFACKIYDENYDSLQRETQEETSSSKLSYFGLIIID
jgi:hypothetical protein